MAVRDAGPGQFVVLSQWLAARVFQWMPLLRDKIANIGEIAGYLSWIDRHFSGRRVLCSRREHVWRQMLRFASSTSVRGLEFGVAWGYATQWWLRHSPQPGLRWEGFDRFVGLPRAWRQLPAGAFNAAGQTPDLEDPRLIWHVGDVEDTLAMVDWSRRANEQWIILFDLDLFEPTLAVWQAVSPFLQPGDLLYFDEAFDRDERHVLDHWILPFARFDLIAYSPLALALRLRHIR